MNAVGSGHGQVPDTVADGGGPLVNNFRPPQLLNSRVVTYTFSELEIPNAWPFTSTPFSDTWSWCKESVMGRDGYGIIP